MSMDLSFVTEEGKLNVRACAVILHEGKILAMRDERSPYYYLPGGRVQMGETAENAVLRELSEELDIEAKIERPLWLNQAFFTEDVDHLRYHELGFYFLMDVTKSDLFFRGQSFLGTEEKHSHIFEWLPFEKLKELYFYPEFLKTAITDLPEAFTLRTEME